MLTPRQVKWLRVAGVVALLAATVVLGRFTDLGELLSREGLRRMVGTAGAAGPFLYVGAFALGLFFHVPAAGILFVAVGVTVFGHLPGAALAYAGSLVGVLFSFFVVRAVGGKPLATIKNPRIARLLARVDARPLTTVIVLRVIFFAAAPVNYALALSGLRARDFVVGSAIGLIPPVVTLALFFELIFGPG